MIQFSPADAHKEAKTAMWYGILLGGGAGTRMAAGVNKVLLPLAGVPVIRRAADCLAPFVAGLVTVCPPEEREAF